MDELKNLSVFGSAGASGLRTYELSLKFFSKKLLKQFAIAIGLQALCFFRTFVWDKIKQNNRVDMWSLNR